MAKRTLIDVYGGTNLDQPQQRFVAALARALLTEQGIVVVTGGFRIFDDRPDHKSVDNTAATAAETYLTARGEVVDRRLETWLPDAGQDRALEGVQRFSKGTPRQLRGDSAQARRFVLVRDADALVTISGEGNTRTVLELAHTLGRTALPLPFTGGDSAAYWFEHRDEIGRRFRQSDQALAELEHVNLSALSAVEMEALATRVVREILLQGVRRRCLVLMPFDPDLFAFYDDVLRPAIEDHAGFEAIRIDRRTETGGIYQQFLQHLEGADAVIMDITGSNPNVMYELGHAHARRIDPYLIHRGALDKTVEKKLPFYLLPERIEAWDVATQTGRDKLMERIEAFLSDVRSRA
jgi:hypothetical protein